MKIDAMSREELARKAEEGLPAIKKAAENLLDAYAEIYALNLRIKAKSPERTP